jgi:nicotinamide-nucleotide amidase
MAEGVARLMDADVGMSTTGVVGPEPEEGQPVGTVFVAVWPHEPAAVRHDLRGEPDRIRTAAAQAALCQLADALDGEQGGADAR